MNPPPSNRDKAFMTTVPRFWVLLLLAGATFADMRWDFEVSDPRPSAISGIYGYVYPSATSPGQTSKHFAKLSRVSDDQGARAKLRFQLDGARYPSAGFGLMFDDAAPVDLRSLAAITLRLRADKLRKLRLSLAPSDAALKLAADTGVSFGRDTTVSSTWSTWTIAARDLAWPKWTTAVPTVTRDQILSRIFAVQFDLGCETKSGACTLDSGWIEVDDVQLQGVGGAWKEPEPGNCGEDPVWIDRFTSTPSRQNELGGWWYAYTDRSSLDTTARGTSSVVNALNTDSADTWLGPDLSSQSASLQFALRRGGPYSGYAAIETQLAEPVASIPQSRSFPKMTAISFRLGFDEDFPEGLGGVVVHLRKAGRAFLGGRDHQIRIPYAKDERDVCLELTDFAQPTWSEWVEPFTPDSLATLSFEVRLPPSLDDLESGFHVSNLAFHGQSNSSVGPHFAGHGPRVREISGGWLVTLPAASPTSAPWQLVGVTGAVRASGVVPPGTRSFSIPSVDRGLSILRLGGSRPATVRLLEH